ncbi:DedA family protein [Helicobacter suis]|uniref:DedA family protein n=1 Tax=Helicobacter suis TaxID=104628 RepID=UPI0013CFFBE4|nr:DedA family protein [Helicobacter suis]
MQETLQHFQDMFNTWGYLLLFVYSLGSGYVGIVLAGILSAGGHMDIKMSMLVAGLGNFVGSCLLVYVGRTQKKELHAYLTKHRRKFALIYIWIRKYGAWLIFINKYIYGVKTMVPLAIGLSKFDFKRFVWLNALSCMLWTLILSLLAYYASTWMRHSLEQSSTYSYILPLIFIGFLIILWLLIIKLSKKINR